jgi:hypothetical protein
MKSRDNIKLRDMIDIIDMKKIDIKRIDIKRKYEKKH